MSKNVKPRWISVGNDVRQAKIGKFNYELVRQKFAGHPAWWSLFYKRGMQAEMVESHLSLKELKQLAMTDAKRRQKPTKLRVKITRRIGLSEAAFNRGDVIEGTLDVNGDLKITRIVSRAKNREGESWGNPGWTIVKTSWQKV